MKAFNVLLALGFCACATSSNNYVQRGGPPLLASMEPVMVNPAPVPDKDPAWESMPVSGILEDAFAALRDGQHERSARAFEAAIATNSLNDAGRAWAYWHVYVNHRERGRLEDSADALQSFVVVGSDILAAESFGVGTDTEFVHRFDLKRRLNLARAMLSVLWAQRNPVFGRSANAAVPVQSVEEANYYVELAAPCGDEHRSIERKAQARGSEMIRHVTVACPNVSESVDLYFVE